MTREAKMQKRRETGKTYTYKPNPYPVDSKEYKREKRRRAHKNTSRKLPVANMRSIMAKLDNKLAKEAALTVKDHGKKEKIA